jgi:hypothetical protein
MSYFHDPQKQIGYLQQCLSSDKKPLGLFLGAGCPMAIRPDAEGKAPLIPDIEGITKVVRDTLSRCEDCEPILTTIEGHFKKDGRTNTTIEDMLSHIRALRVVAGSEEVRGSLATNSTSWMKGSARSSTKSSTRVFPTLTRHTITLLHG